jgi:cobalt-zinc-cadmium efflux system membrane fusion protein
MRKNKTPLLLIALVIAAIAAFFIFDGEKLPENNAKATESGEHHEEGEQADSTEITAEAAQAAGIETIVVGPGDIRETVQLTGRVILDQNRSAAVKARFPGVVRGVFKQVGEPVKRGEKLATVESNDSLQVYAVPSPLNGVVLERNISVGDTAADIPVFTVADLSKLWVEFFVFAADMPAIQQGQAIQLRTLDGKLTADSVLDTIQPMAEASSQTIVARATLDNSSGQWRAGMTVQGDAVVRAQPVNLAVPTIAIQRFEGKEVVFVREGTHYRAVPVTLGLADAKSTEITEGLSAGVEVVSKNSFLVKADISKAGAGHED